jgi:hypothetical protein
MSRCLFLHIKFIKLQKRFIFTYLKTKSKNEWFDTRPLTHVPPTRGVTMCTWPLCTRLHPRQQLLQQAYHAVLVPWLLPEHWLLRHWRHCYNGGVHAVDSGATVAVMFTLRTLPLHLLHKRPNLTPVSQPPVTLLPEPQNIVSSWTSNFMATP